jgi:ubiquinone/menaquinone biosynthesis C-methylase UbiE
MLLTNLETDSGSTLPESCADYVLIHNVLFQVGDKVKLIKEARRVLKSEGKLLVVEWSLSSLVGPKQSDRLSESELESLVSSLGFTKTEKLDTSQAHYAILFQKDK